MNKPLCVIAGVGPGNGMASARRFSQAGYSLALLARDEQALRDYAGEFDDARTYACDLTLPESVAAACSAILQECGVPRTVIYNAGSWVSGAPLQTSRDDFESAWRVNALGLLCITQGLAPAMLEQGGGNLVVMGATASLRGGAKFAAFSSAKAAQRNLAQSLARSLGPRGLHVALVIIDGIADIPITRRMLPDKPDDFFLRPAAIAESVYQLTRQQHSAWTFELDLRPSGERW